MIFQDSREFFETPFGYLFIVARGEDTAEYENDPTDAERSQAFSETIYTDLTENLNSRGSRGFYVVGKNHLFDQKGIIKNLKLRGFSIQKIQ